MKPSKTIILLAAAILFAPSCRPDPRVRSDDAGQTDEEDDQLDGNLADRAVPDGDFEDDGHEDSGVWTNCAEGAQWIYLIGSGRALVRYYPDDNELEQIGTVSCQAGGQKPFSMAVDRSATAWVLHRDGRIYHVSTDDSSCAATDFIPNQEDVNLFGMGFVSTYQGSNEEELFVAGGPETGVASGTATLSIIDTSTLELSTIRSLPGWPELTGTGRGDLWGFFPDTVPPSIRQIDKETGDSLEIYPLDALQGITPMAWAFAFWGGDFYVFLKRMMDNSTHIWRLDPDTGDFEDIYPSTGFHIVGAGVSTCAPIELY